LIVWQKAMQFVTELNKPTARFPIACNLKYITEPDFETAFSRSRELERMLTSLIEKVKG